jgi:abequosyltransferase
MNKFISICIPSYNRPKELERLLDSIPISCQSDIEVIICEDNSPKREEIRQAMNLYKKKSPLDIHYYENAQNYGYDKNLRELILKASGEFIIYMGDDDILEKENFLAFIKFCKENKQLGYILKRHTYIHGDGAKEPFRYFNEHKYFDKGDAACKILFRKSVFISGFCFKREAALPYLIDIFDGTLLYQLYILSEITLKYPSAYCDIPLTIQAEDMRGIPMFGSSLAENKLYTPGTITIDNSINFMTGYLKIARYIDSKYNIGFLKFLRNDISKYSYPILSIQRDKGIKLFLGYCKRVEEELQINESIYYSIYKWSLVFLGRNNCDKIIYHLKKILGKTPAL